MLLVTLQNLVIALQSKTMNWFQFKYYCKLYASYLRVRFKYLKDTKPLRRDKLLLTAEFPEIVVIHLINKGQYFETDIKTELKMNLEWNHVTLTIATE